MSTPFMAEIKIASFNFAPKGWAVCNGQFLPINQNQALFSLLGTTYGGDGQETFGIPDLRGRIPMHVGNNHIIGESGGTESVALTVQPPRSSVSCLGSASASLSPTRTRTATAGCFAT